MPPPHSALSNMKSRGGGWGLWRACLNAFLLNNYSSTRPGMPGGCVAVNFATGVGAWCPGRGEDRFGEGDGWCHSECRGIAPMAPLDDATFR